MKIPLSWLLEYLPATQSPSEIASLLTSIGLEVDAIEECRPSFVDIVVGKVVAAEKHPNADHLTVARVTDGEEVYQVVCGAPNCREGMKTAFCKVGGSFSLEDGTRFKLKPAKIRGVESFGMLCSGKELGISGDEQGILEFSDSIAEGADLGELLAEKVFTISLTPNLGHCGSVFGVARELAALLGLPLHPPKIDLRESEKEKAVDSIAVQIDDPDLCSRFGARVIRGVQVAPAPFWLQEKLIRAGMRPVNNVVDVTNFVLLELGHPLHAYDLNKIRGKILIARSSKAGEELETLDGKRHVLEKGAIVIADREHAVALGGVIGGAETEVSPSTVDIVLESAVFDPVAVRKTSRKLALFSEASRQFERGCDPEGSLVALDRAAALIAEVSGGTVAKGRVVASKKEFPQKTIALRIPRVNALLGTQLSHSEVERIFQKLSFPYTAKEKDLLSIQIPTYRVDLGTEIDLVEEVARFYGYDNIPRKISRSSPSTTPHSPIYLLEKRARERCVAEGLQEVLTCDLISPGQVELLLNGTIPAERVVRVLNPSSQDQSVLRPSILPGLLQVVKYNIDRQNYDFAGFEVGRIHLQEGEFFKEQSVIGIVLTGAELPHHPLSGNQSADFYTLKGIVENLLRSFGVPEVEFLPGHFHIFHPGRQAVYRRGEVLIGTLGELHPSLTREVAIQQRVYYAEMNLHDVMSLQKPPQKMKPFSHFPYSLRDWTLTLPNATPIAKVFGAAHQCKSSLLEGVSLHDIYRGERIGSDNKNVTMRFIYRALDKTVSQEEVDGEHSRLTKEILTKLGKERI